jgi:hypothetical protein
MNPGMTIARLASITSASGAVRFGPTAAILPPETSTSARSKSPTAGSSESTQPFLIRIGRPGAGAGLGCACAFAAGLVTSAGTAAAAATLVHRNPRRDTCVDPHAQPRSSCPIHVISSSLRAPIVRGVVALPRRLYQGSSPSSPDY